MADTDELLGTKRPWSGRAWTHVSPGPDGDVPQSLTQRNHAPTGLGFEFVLVPGLLDSEEAAIDAVEVMAEERGYARRQIVSLDLNSAIAVDATHHWPELDASHITTDPSQLAILADLYYEDQIVTSDPILGRHAVDLVRLQNAQGEEVTLVFADAFGATISVASQSIEEAHRSRPSALQDLGLDLGLAFVFALVTGSALDALARLVVHLTGLDFRHSLLTLTILSLMAVGVPIAGRLRSRRGRRHPGGRRRPRGRTDGARWSQRQDDRSRD